MDSKKFGNYDEVGPKFRTIEPEPAGARLIRETRTDQVARVCRCMRHSAGDNLFKEIEMKMLLAAAALLLVSTAAQAQITFEYNGRTIRVDPDRGTVSIPGVYDNTGRRSKKAKTDQDSSRKQQVPHEAKTEPQQPAQSTAAPAGASATDQTALPAPATVASPSQPEAPPSPPTTTANAPAATTVSPPLPAPGPEQRDAAPAVPPQPAPTVATAPTAPPPASVQQPAPAAIAAPVHDSNSPLGLWLTEEKEGRVRIEQCGATLCGYSVDAKSNQNGEQILINMKPAKDQQWTGRILDPNNGSTYDSTIAMQGPDQLRVQGCAFNGMFCGGQTWSRVN